LKESAQARDASLDSFARAMSELAASSKAQVGNGTVIPIMSVGSAPAAAAPPQPAPPRQARRW
jgi:hypothetical protein